jgi:hypothetical protein
MFGKKKRDPEPEIPAGYIRDADTGEVRRKVPGELTWQELGHKSEADYRHSLEKTRVKLAQAEQRYEQHAHNRDLLYRMGFIDE